LLYPYRLLLFGNFFQLGTLPRASLRNQHTPAQYPYNLDLHFTSRSVEVRR